ncbi:uncharacterized protein LOC141851495 [Brevipalpus obovatus]|uniref:uncharacterized protein LOC141851495 n=1 Tax=Brevipalpus obovatus TaxID=246614 RepID=UPI003D9E4D9F
MGIVVGKTCSEKIINMVDCSPPEHGSINLSQIDCTRCLVFPTGDNQQQDSAAHLPRQGRATPYPRISAALREHHGTLFLQDKATEQPMNLSRDHQKSSTRVWVNNDQLLYREKLDCSLCKPRLSPNQMSSSSTSSLSNMPTLGSKNGTSKVCWKHENVDLKSLPPALRSIVERNRKLKKPAKNVSNNSLNNFMPSELSSSDSNSPHIDNRQQNARFRSQSGSECSVSSIKSGTILLHTPRKSPASIASFHSYANVDHRAGSASSMMRSSSPSNQCIRPTVSGNTIAGKVGDDDHSLVADRDNGLSIEKMRPAISSNGDSDENGRRRKKEKEDGEDGEEDGEEKDDDDDREESLGSLSIAESTAGSSLSPKLETPSDSGSNCIPHEISRLITRRSAIHHLSKSTSSSSPSTSAPVSPSSHPYPLAKPIIALPDDLGKSSILSYHDQNGHQPRSYRPSASRSRSVTPSFSRHHLHQHHQRSYSFDHGGGDDDNVMNNQVNRKKICPSSPRPSGNDNTIGNGLHDDEHFNFPPSPNSPFSSPRKHSHQGTNECNLCKWSRAGRPESSWLSLDDDLLKTIKSYSHLNQCLREKEKRLWKNDMSLDLKERIARIRMKVRVRVSIQRKENGNIVAILKDGSNIYCIEANLN